MDILMYNKYIMLIFRYLESRNQIIYIYKFVLATLTKKMYSSEKWKLYSKNDYINIF